MAKLTQPNAKQRGASKKTGELFVRDFTRHPAISPTPFEKARQAVLPAWDISLVFAGPTRARALNKALRNKTYTPNVLSYVAGKQSGEIIICRDVAKKQAPLHGHTPSRFVLALFIHGLFHLKGMRHGTTMEESERAVLARVVSSTRRT